MKLGKRSRWMISSVIFVIVLAIFFTQVGFVQAISDVHTGEVLVRLETEIMQKTPAGQYYNSLLGKHVNEFNQIASADLGHVEVLLDDIRVFIPELEALLDGKGDTVEITSEHVKRLKVELDWFAAKGSPALREDIQKEQQRFPLDNFVGMTMSDALVFINSKIVFDEMSQQIPMPDVVWQPEPTPELMVKQTFVPGSNGKWSYYFQNGIYLEYPTSYYVRLPISDGYVGLVPSRNLPRDWNPSELMVEMLNMSVLENDILNPSDWYPAERILWHREVQNREFEGFEMIQRLSDTQGVDLIAILYNRENQRLVYIHVYDGDENLPTAERFDYYNWINEHYEYFQHMVDHIRLQTP
jgi:hypothetical protein